MPRYSEYDISLTSDMYRYRGKYLSANMGIGSRLVRKKEYEIKKKLYTYEDLSLRKEINRGIEYQNLCILETIMNQFE